MGGLLGLRPHTRCATTRLFWSLDTYIQKNEVTEKKVPPYHSGKNPSQVPLQSTAASHVVAPEDLAGCEDVSDEGIYLEGDEQQAEIRRR